MSRHIFKCDNHLHIFKCDNHLWLFKEGTLFDTCTVNFFSNPHETLKPCFYPMLLWKKYNTFCLFVLMGYHPLKVAKYNSVSLDSKPAGTHSWVSGAGLHFQQVVLGNMETLEQSWLNDIFCALNNGGAFIMSKCPIFLLREDKRFRLPEFPSGGQQ